MLPEWLLWVLTAGLILLGFLGTLLPFLPGLFLIVIASFVHLFPQITAKPLGYTQFIVIFALFFAGVAADYFMGFIGARFGGVSRAGLLMGIVGMIVGVFAAPWGIILGPLVGVFLGEYIVSNKAVPNALKATTGYALGSLSALLVKIVLAAVMSAILIISLLRA